MVVFGIDVEYVEWFCGGDVEVVVLIDGVVKVWSVVVF